MSEKSEYQKTMDSNILSIEASIGEHLSKGHVPEILIARTSLLEQIFEHLDYTDQINWNDPEGVIIGMGDGQIPLRVFRSNDVPYGIIIVR